MIEDLVDDTRSYLICLLVPPEVAFVIAQAASFRVLNSALQRISTRAGMMFESITPWSDKKQPVITVLSQGNAKKACIDTVTVSFKCNSEIANVPT